MKELNCKNCDSPTYCSAEAVAVTCSDCVTESLSNCCSDNND